MRHVLAIGELRIPVPKGETPDQTYWRHVRLALSEGTCPNCLRRLDGERRCWPCNKGWFDDGMQVGWDALVVPGSSGP